MDEKLKQHGAISWSELMTSDMKAAKSFYSQLFGWEYADVPAADMTYSLVKTNGEESAGIMPIPPEAGQMPPAWGIYVTVDDVDATAEKAVGLGAKVVKPPQDIPRVGRFCVLGDPQGAFISIISYS
jgi:predicted enzyme related to lactoylglutathione lyase